MVHFNEEGSQLKLFTPGPVHVPERIREELAKPNDTHRSQPYHDLHKSARKYLQQLLHTQEDCLIFTSSATGVMEAAVRNLIKREEKALFLSCGAFGERWIKIARKNGKDFDVVRVEKGRAFTADIVKKALSQDEYAIVFMQGNETSTGVYNTKLDEIAPLVKDSGALLAVDDTSGMAGIDINVDELDLDVCLASVQKAFALPPGLAVSSISTAAYEKAEEVENRGHYFDFSYFRKKSRENETPTTPPIPQIRALNAQLKYIIEQEGLENRIKRHEKLAERVQEWVQDLGFKMFSKPGFRSNTVSCIENSLDIDIAQMVQRMLERGYRIVNGYGDLAGRTFRIGHMGEITIEMVNAMLDELTEVVERLRYD